MHRRITVDGPRLSCQANRSAPPCVSFTKASLSWGSIQPRALRERRFDRRPGPAAPFSCPPGSRWRTYPLSAARQTKGRREAYSAQIPAEPPAGESPVTGGSGALRIVGAASRSAQRKMHDMVFGLHRRSGPQGGLGRDVAGHSFRTGKPCCHPSRTQAPSDVVLHPTPHPPAPQAGPARAKATKKAPKQAKRIIGSAPRGLGPRVKLAPRILFL